MLGLNGNKTYPKLNICQTKCSDCNISEWISPLRNVRMDPPGNTVAVIVDVRSNQGRFKLWTNPITMSMALGLKKLGI